VLAAGCAAHQAGPEVVGRQYRTEISGAGVVSAELGEPGGASLPLLVEPEPGLRVVEVRSAGAPAGARVVVQLSRTPDGVRSFGLEEPRRCVVDLAGEVWDSAGQDTLSTEGELAPRLRIGRHPDKIRLVLEVAENASGDCVTTEVGSAIVLGVGGLPIGAHGRTLYSVSDAPLGATEQAAFVLARVTGDTAAMAAVAAVRPKPALDPEVAAIREIARRAAQSPQRPEPEAAAPPLASVEATRPRPTASFSRAPVPASPYSGKRITLEFKDADILNVMRIIADVAQRNIVATDDVSGRVTIVLHDVPWDQALDILLKSTGLEMVSYDDVLVVSTSKRLEEERKSRLAARLAGRRLENLQTAYFRVNYVNPNEIARILRGGSSTSGSGARAAGTIAAGSGIVDGPGQRRGLLSSRGMVMVNEGTNTIIVRDVADGVANAAELVRKLDIQIEQVAIQGLIFEADTQVARDLGVRWGASHVGSPETGNPTGRNFPGRIGVGGGGPRDVGGGEGGATRAPILVDFPAKGVAAGAGSTLGLLLGSLDGATQLDAEITAIENDGKGKVISRPKIITLNNREATIQSLEILRVKLPSTGTVINTGAGGSAGSNSVATQAIDTGIILRVTPQVSSDGYILLQIFVKSSVPSTASTDGIPNEISRQATSQVLVRDGETGVIGVGFLLYSTGL
ncbi:MAG: secretin N-terminal domain-containing protein, partial [bacterium]